MSRQRGERGRGEKNLKKNSKSPHYASWCALAAVRLLRLVLIFTALTSPPLLCLTLSLAVSSANKARGERNAAEFLLFS